jgi:hypothetical protein
MRSGKLADGNQTPVGQAANDRRANLEAPGRFRERDPISHLCTTPAKEVIRYPDYALWSPSASSDSSDSSHSAQKNCCLAKRWWRILGIRGTDAAESISYSAGVQLDSPVRASSGRMKRLVRASNLGVL